MAERQAQAQAAAAEAARKAEEDAYYKRVAASLAESTVSNPYYVPKPREVSQGGILGDTVIGALSGFNSLAQSGISIADHKITQVAKPVKVKDEKSQ